MVLPVRMRIHWGMGRFCFCFLPRIFLVLKVFWDGCWAKREGGERSENRGGKVGKTRQTLIRVADGWARDRGRAASRPGYRRAIARGRLGENALDATAHPLGVPGGGPAAASRRKTPRRTRHPALRPRGVDAHGDAGPRVASTRASRRARRRVFGRVGVGRETHHLESAFVCPASNARSKEGWRAASGDPLERTENTSREGLNKKTYAEQSADVRCIGYVVWKNVQLPKKNKFGTRSFSQRLLRSPPRVSAPAVDVAPRHV